MSEAKVHHVLSPSGLHRITNCIGSVYGPGRSESNEFAREGTACHSLLEFCLATGANPRDLEGVAEFSDEFPVTLEMIEAVELFIAEVKRVCDEFNIPHSRIRAEEKLVHSQIPNQMFGGTMDCQVPGDEVLIVADLKFGRNQVYADSIQLTAYSILSLDKMEKQPLQVIQIIIQPRGGTTVSRYELGADEINETWNKIGMAAGHILRYPDRSKRAPIEHLKAGEWCKYCPQSAGCPAREAMVTDMIQIGTFPNPTSGDLIVSPTQELSTEVLVDLMKKGDAVREFLDDVKKALITRASMGQEIPGHKLVLSYGHRKWTDEDEEAMLKKIPKAKLGLTVKEITIKKLGSPAQVEKILKAKGTLQEVKERFDRLVVSKPIGVRLVENRARGEAIRPETAVEFLTNMKDTVDE